MILIGSPAAHAASRAVASTAPEIYLEHFTIPYNTNLTIQTTNSSFGADPVLHLLRDNGNGTYTQLAWNDNYSGYEARISYTNYSTTYNDFYLVLRAKTYSTRGTCDLLKGGLAYQWGVPVGGNIMPKTVFTFSAGDELRTVHVPGGSVAPMLLKFSTTTGYTISGMGLGNGIGSASIVALAGNEQHFLVGTPWLRDGATYLTPRAGAANVMSNDVASDADGDGVGDDLEDTLGLCANTTGCPDNATGHGRDTDRDGLSDGEEIWGVAGTLADGADDLPFSRWGANPRKKDVFLEVDYLTGIGGVLAPNGNPFQWMRDNPTSNLGSWDCWPQGSTYCSPEDWYDKAEAPFAAGPNSHVRNPDGSDGVALHLDTGVAPIDPADESEFGDWSSGSSRALVPDFTINILDTIDGDVTVTINGVNETFNATGLSTFQIALALSLKISDTGEPVQLKSYTDNGDDTHTLVYEAEVHGVHFTRSLSVPAGYEDAVSTPSEDGASLREHYWNDPDQVDEVRLGIVRYAVVTGLRGGGAAEPGGACFASGLGHGAFIHELGHTLGLEHWGHNEWETTGPSCFPHYQSLMRYGAPPYRFSDTEGIDWLNPSSTQETNPFGAGYDHSIYAPWPYYYSATTSTVDWNRDGTTSPSGTYWRSPALEIYGPEDPPAGDNQGGHSSCGSFVQGRNRIVPNEDVVGAVDLVRAGTRLYAFWVSGVSVKYKFATLGSVGQKSCTENDDPASGPCVDWSPTYTLSSGYTYQGISAYEYSGYIFIAFRTSSNTLYVRNLQVAPGGTLSISTTWVMPTSSASYRSAHTPELVRLHTSSLPGTLAMVYLSESGTFRQYRWTGSTWGSTSYSMLDSTTSHNQITGGQGPAALDWPDASVTAFSANEKRTVALLPSASGSLRLYVLDYMTGFWTSVSLGILGTTEGKPFIAYRHQRQTDGNPRTDFPGNLMIGSMTPCIGGYCPYVELLSQTSRTTPPGMGLTKEYVADYLQNEWAITEPGTSASLYSDSTIDNVFGLATHAEPLTYEYGVNFYPHADGSPNHSYGMRSDFRVMEDNICDRLGSYARPGWPTGFPCGEVHVLD